MSRRTIIQTLAGAQARAVAGGHAKLAPLRLGRPRRLRAEFQNFGVLRRLSEDFAQGGFEYVGRPEDLRKRRRQIVDEVDPGVIWRLARPDLGSLRTGCAIALAQRPAL